MHKTKAPVFLVPRHFCAQLARGKWPAVRPFSDAAVRSFLTHWALRGTSVSARCILLLASLFPRRRPSAGRPVRMNGVCSGDASATSGSVADTHGSCCTSGTFRLCAWADSRTNPFTRLRGWAPLGPFPFLGGCLFFRTRRPKASHTQGKTTMQLFRRARAECAYRYTASSDRGSGDRPRVRAYKTRPRAPCSVIRSRLSTRI